MKTSYIITIIPINLIRISKIVENFDFSGWYDADKNTYESEDTLSILNSYIEDSEVNLDKATIKKMVGEIYQEACGLV